MAAYLVCAACKVRIGPDYVTKRCAREPFGDAIVCADCGASLRRRHLSAYESLIREGTLRRPPTPMARVPRPRGRRPRTTVAAA